MRIILITLGIILGISAGGIILVSIRRLNEIIRLFFTRILLVMAFCVCFGGLPLAEAGIEIVRHEISKDKDGKLKKGIIGVNYTDPVTGRVSYRERVFTVGVGGDFPAIPTKVEFRSKIKEWLTTIPPVNADGKQDKSVLQSMKDETAAFVESFSALKESDAGSLLKTTIQE